MPSSRSWLMIGDQHDAVQHRDAEERDEPDRRAQVEVQPAQPQRGDAADERERHVQHHEQRLAAVAEAGIQQRDDQQRARAARSGRGASWRAADSRTARRRSRSSRPAALTRSATARCTSAANPPRSRPRTLLCTMTIRSPFSWLISSGPSTTCTRATCDSEHLAARRRRQQQLPDRLGRAAVRRREPHDDRKPPSAVDDLGRLRAADAGLHRLAHVGDVQPVARERAAVERQLELHRAGADIHRDVRGAGHVGDHVPNLARLLLEHRRGRRRTP